MGEFVKRKHRVALMMVFQCSVVNFPLLTAALKEYASDSAIDLVGFQQDDDHHCENGN